MANEIICGSCGKRCSDSVSYCPSCYASLKTQIEEEAADDHLIDGIDENLWKEFMGPQSTDFVQLLKKQKNKKLFVRTNFFALILPMQWFFCHKMHLVGICYFLLPFLILVLFKTFFQANYIIFFVLIFIALLIRALAAIFANTLYKEHVRRELSKAKPNMKKGGLSFGTAIAATIITSVLYSYVLEPFLLLFLSK